MKPERSKVEFPLWRKKVDKSLFEHNGTTIPLWACKMWALPSRFRSVSSKLDVSSKVTIRFQDKSYIGWVTVAKHGRTSPAYRLWFEENLTLQLKYTFLMSYMRSLEQSLNPGVSADIEKDIPFWEFLDIEYDLKSNVFRFVAYYKQEPSFSNLFERLIGSPSLHRISDELEGKEDTVIYKQDWKPRAELHYEIGATNALYLLIDTVGKLLYVGEAQDLISRLQQPHSSIPKWDYFRYDVLPAALVPYRVVLERMLIRYLAALLPSKKDLSRFRISKYSLVNTKIDK